MVLLQAPGSSYTVSGSTITFASNLVTGDVINFIHILGSVLDLGVPSDGTVTVSKVANDLISAKTALGTEPACYRRIFSIRCWRFKANGLIRILKLAGGLSWSRSI